jgi:putative ABC transport system permease protein
VYLPFRQNPSFHPTLVVRGPNASGLVEHVRAAVTRLDPETPVSDVRTLEQLRTEALAAPRVTALLQALFAGLALLVTAAGLGGVIAYSVGRRTQEIGIRMAMGATRYDVVSLVLRQGLQATLAGVALGAVGALAVGRLLSGLLFGVHATDVACFVGSALVLVAVSVLACLVPARRATSIDPLTALRT